MTEPSGPRSAMSRFLAWGSAELFFIIGVVIAILFAILSPSVAKELHLSQSQLGTLSGTFFITYSVGQLVLGSLLGSHSPRLILGTTAVLSVAGCLLFAVSANMPVALAARILLGVGLSSTFVGVVHIIGRDYPQRFAFMTALSQSLANVSGAVVALVASATTIFAVFREPFIVTGVLLLPIVAALLLFVGGYSTKPEAAAEATPSVPTRTIVATCLRSGQFWMALLYYSCLFGTILAYSDLWDIQFQMEFFRHSTQQSALLNAMIPLGVTLGSIVAGAWAQARGDFVLPARAFGAFGVAVFAVMFLLSLSEEVALAANFCIGFALSGSILGLSAVQTHLPKPAQAMGTALVVTAAFIAGGVIQPFVGLMLEAPVRSGSLFALVLSDNPDFSAYQKGLLLLIGYVGLGFVASLFFKSARSKPQTPRS